MENQQIALRPNSLAEVEKFATALHKSGACGKDCLTPAHVMAKIMAGAEMGMAPMEAKQGLYIVSGKITIYGMALSARLRKRGWKIERVTHSATECKLKISKGEESYEEGFTLEEVKKMIPKSVALENNPYDKMYWFILARLVRFHVPEIFDGSGVQYIYEEFDEGPTEPAVIRVIDPEAEAPAVTAELPY